MSWVSRVLQIPVVRERKWVEGGVKYESVHDGAEECGDDLLLSYVFSVEGKPTCLL